MRRVVKANMILGLEIVDALPGNVLAARLISRNLFYYGVIRIDGDVARHAETHAGDARLGAGVDAYMAVLAHKSFCQMRFMREGNRLFGRGVKIEKIAQRGADRAVRRSENASVGRRSTWRLRRQRPFDGE